MAARQSRSTARTSAGLARSQDRWREQDYEIRLPPGRVPGLRTLSIEHPSGNHDCLTLADSYERIGLASPDDRIDAEMNDPVGADLRSHTKRHAFARRLQVSGADGIIHLSIN